VLDCVCGSGTTAVVAESSVDGGSRRPGPIRCAYNAQASLVCPRPQTIRGSELGKYERQIWQMAEFGESAASRMAAYRAFILDLYSARLSVDTHGSMG